MEQQDKIITKFDMGRIAHQTKLPLICIYKGPADYPDKYVARLWDLQQPTRIITVADTLEEIRQTIPPGMVPLPRDTNDDPCIVESWI